MITIQDIHKTYHSGDTAVHALRGVDLTIADGAFIAIAGPFRFREKHPAQHHRVS